MQVRNFIEITLSRIVSQINVFSVLLKISRWPTKNGGKVNFAKCCQYTLQIPCGSKILSKSLYLAVFNKCEINAFLHFTQKFKMAAKSGGKVIFVKSPQYTLDTLRVKNFDEIPLSRTVQEIEANLYFSIFGENSKWPSFLGRGKSFENWQE